MIYTEVAYQGGRPFDTTATSPDLGILGDFKSNNSTTHLIKKIPPKMHIVAISRGCKINALLSSSFLTKEVLGYDQGELAGSS